MYRTFSGGRVSLQSRQVGGCHSTITLYSKHVECIKVLLHHYFRRYCFQISYLGIIYHSPSYFSKKSRSKWVFGKKFSQIQFFVYFVTEAKRWACWYLFWYQCLIETLQANHWFQNEHHTGVHFENLRGVVTTPFVSCVTKISFVRRGLN